MTDKPKSIADQIALAAARHVCSNVMVPPAPVDASRAIELAYGLLWLAPYDASSPQGQCISLARRTLLGELDRAGQARGITAAKAALAPALESRKTSRTS